jgi:hypothetical protein
MTAVEAAAERKAPMKKLGLEERAGQVGPQDGRFPVPGEAVYIGIDVARSKWVYNVRWGGQTQRKLTTPGELKHLQSLVGEYSKFQVHVDGDVGTKRTKVSRAEILDA